MIGAWKNVQKYGNWLQKKKKHIKITPLIFIREIKLQTVKPMNGWTYRQTRLVGQVGWKTASQPGGQAYRDDSQDEFHALEMNVPGKFK